MLLPPPRSTLFPYTTLFRSQEGLGVVEVFSLPKPRVSAPFLNQLIYLRQLYNFEPVFAQGFHYIYQCREGYRFGYERDRKSTRLNSSHGYISYAVFCLKKKK